MEGDACHIDSLLLSCRVIGRGIETALLAHLGIQAMRDGARRLVGEYIPTKKNAPCAEFYMEHGFAMIPPIDGAVEGSQFYEFDLTTSVPASPAWITLEGSDVNEHSTSTVLTP